MILHSGLYVSTLSQCTEVESWRRRPGDGECPSYAGIQDVYACRLPSLSTPEREGSGNGMSTSSLLICPSVSFSPLVLHFKGFLVQILPAVVYTQTLYRVRHSFVVAFLYTPLPLHTVIP